MRPQRARVIVRSSGLQSRYSDDTFVLRTSHHSSSRIRSNRLSRVTPALFTSTSGTTPSVFSCSSSALDRSWSRRRARRRHDRRYLRCSERILNRRRQLRSSRYRSTNAPSRPNRSRMARPMPRVAPVTSAVLRSAVSHRRPLPAPRRTRRRVPIANVAACAVDTLDQPAEHFARATLDERRCPACRSSLRHSASIARVSTVGRPGCVESDPDRCLLSHRRSE